MHQLSTLWSYLLEGRVARNAWIWPSQIDFYLNTVLDLIIRHLTSLVTRLINLRSWCVQWGIMAGPCDWLMLRSHYLAASGGDGAHILIWLSSGLCKTMAAWMRSALVSDGLDSWRAARVLMEIMWLLPTMPISQLPGVFKLGSTWVWSLDELMAIIRLLEEG